MSLKQPIASLMSLETCHRPDLSPIVRATTSQQQSSCPIFLTFWGNDKLKGETCLFTIPILFWLDPKPCVVILLFRKSRVVVDVPLLYTSITLIRHAVTRIYSFTCDSAFH